MKRVGYLTNKMLCAFLCFFTTVSFSQFKYVKVQSVHFSLDDKPYFFVGTNFWYGCYIGSTGQTGKRERLIRELDRMKAIGIDNLRILGASESSTAQGVVKPAIQISPGVYDDSLLVGLDFLLSEMYKRDMRAVIFLNNYWNWSGGMAQYLVWYGGGIGSYDTSPFYRNVDANATYKKYISDLINRRNTITGLYYYEDPAIMAWELANEPRPGGNSTYYNAFYQWIDSTAQYIHSLDPNHLVTSGSEGTKGCNESGTIFLSAHQSQYIDYATFHLWAYNWGWINTGNMSGTYPSALSQAKSYINSHIVYARQLNKPLTMEEFGLPRDRGQYDPDSATTFRDNYFSALLQMIYDSAATNSPIAGSNSWGWGGEGRSPNSDYMWRVGDPFVCDPPMEAQGLNSIFDTDSSTIHIIKEHSLLMEGLRGTTKVVRGNVVYDFSLGQNYPNPFNPATMINYTMKVPGNMSLKVFDVLGREIATLVNGFQKEGNHFVTLNADNLRLASGVYLYRLTTGNYSQTKRMVVLK